MERRHTGKKFLAIVVLLGAAFWAGFYVGRQPPEEVHKQLQELSDEVVEQTVGLVEGDFLAQKKIVQATSEFLNGRSKILSGKPKEAVAELDATLAYLDEAARMQGDAASDALREIMSNIEEFRRSLVDGQTVPQEALEDVQERLEALLSQE